MAHRFSAQNLRFCSSSAFWRRALRWVQIGALSLRGALVHFRAPNRSAAAHYKAWSAGLQNDEFLQFLTELTFFDGRRCITATTGMSFRQIVFLPLIGLGIVQLATAIPTGPNWCTSNVTWVISLSSQPDVHERAAFSLKLSVWNIGKLYLIISNQNFLKNHTCSVVQTFQTILS